MTHYASVVLVMGNSGCGKTEAAKILTRELSGIHINGDDVRASSISRHLTFSVQSRIEQAENMGAIADIVSKSGIPAIVDFICPTKQTRKAFIKTLNEQSNLFLVWMNTTKRGKYSDTNLLFEAPEEFIGSHCFYEVTIYHTDKLVFIKDIELIAEDIRKNQGFKHFLPVK